MSVAFRRDGDDEHKEPRFELPIPPGPNWVTPRGRALIEAKVAELEAAIAAVDEAGRGEELRRELRYWHTRLATAEPAPAPAEGEAGIGSRVRVRLGGRERVIAIVGGDEADPARDLLAFTSPLGRALMGAADGDVVDFNGMAGAITVLAVEPNA